MYMSFRHENSPRFRGFPFFLVCLVVIFFFTLKTRVFIAKRTKNRNVGPTKLRKTPEGVLSTKVVIGMCRKHGSQNQAARYINGSLFFFENAVHGWVCLF